ncbi:MAG: hypothetical protein KBS61_06505, partial [Chryseobacterium sp.]|nr:hypothetical protein [Candidatus Chryseobacterium enterohippi]
YKIIISSCILLSVMNCQAQKEEKKTEPKATSVENSIGNSITLVEGENKFLKDSNFSIKFKNIVEDSRCPEGSNCIWQGAAVADIELMGVATRPYHLKLATIDHEGKGYHKSGNFNGYSITMKNVTPYPSVKEGSKSGTEKYKIELIITKKSKNSDSTK